MDKYFIPDPVVKKKKKNKKKKTERKKGFLEDLK